MLAGLRSDAWMVTGTQEVLSAQRSARTEDHFAEVWMGCVLARARPQHPAGAWREAGASGWWLRTC